MRTSILRSLLLLVLVVLPSVAMAQQREDDLERENPQKRREHYYHVRSFPFGRIPQNARLDAIDAMTSKVPTFAEKSRGLQAINAWRLIGPSRVGGRVNAIAVHPSDARTLWAGAASGGVWKSTDRGETWRPVMDFENAIWVGSLAIDPVNPDILYAGTGDPNPSNGDSYPGAGIMKSTDGGMTWRTSGLTNVGSISGIVIDPRNASIVIAGGSDNNAGVYRSTDAGATWTRIINQSVANLAMNPVNPDQLWIGTWSAGVMRSDDLGLTWKAINTGLRSGTATSGRMTVAVAASSPNIIYGLAAEKTAVDLSRIYKSENGGDSWSLVFDSGQNGINFLANAAQTQGWYNNTIAVSPADPNIVVAGGVTMVRTSNGGASWTSVGSSVHPDHHAMIFDPGNPTTFYDGNDGGMYRSSDAGASYETINDGLAINQFYAISLDQRADDLQYGGTQDNGTYAVTSQSAQRIASGDGFFAVVDHSNSNIVYGEYPDGDLWKLDRSNGQMRDLSGSLGGSAQWSAPIVQDPVDPGILFVGRDQVWATVDGGDTWQPISPTVAGQVSAIAFSPKNHQVVYAGSNRGSLIVSRDGGSNWNDYTFTSGLPTRYIADFAPSLTNEAICYVALGGFYSGHIFKTTDYGATWTDVSNNMPDIPVNALAIHPDDDNEIFAGTDLGVFVTLDAGTTWATYMNGLPRTEVIDMEIHRAKRELRIATYGRGMWEIDLERPIVPPSITAPTGGEVWSVGSAHVVGWAGFDGPVNVEFSSDDGQSWMPIASNVTGGVMRWNVANAPTQWGRIRASLASDPSKSATSRTFTLEPLRVGGIVQQQGKPVTPYGLAYDGEYLYTANFYGYQMLKLDPATLNTVGVIDLQIDRRGSDSSLLTDLAYHPGKGTIFMHRLGSINGGGGFLYEVSKSGQQLNRWSSPAGYPIGLAWMGEDNPDLPYLLATDRDGAQQLFLIDPDNGETIITLERDRKVPSGPRGATSAGGGQRFYQVITDFTNNSLVDATAELMTVESQQSSCSIPLAGPSGLMNARGIEYDPHDRNVWVSDFNGNIYKMVTCEGMEVPNSAPASPGVAGVVLSQNAPNPFRDETALTFELPRAAQASVVVHDAAGRLVATLAAGALDAGAHHVRFAPAGLASGVYRYTLLVDGHEAATRTMVLLR